MNVQQNTKKGFTIIEVVLVLAIAALIFLMIFVALPALQRGQRNTARKDDVGTIASAVNSWRSNHSGTVLAAADLPKFKDYVDKTAQIDKSKMTIAASAIGTGPVIDPASPFDNLDSVIIYPGGKCKDDQSSTTGTAKSAAVITILEEGTGAQPYCQSV